MKKVCLMMLVLIFNLTSAYCSGESAAIFEVLNLDYPGLEQVKKLHQAGKNEQAMQALLSYYRTKKTEAHPDIDFERLHVSQQEQQWADDALKHTFFVHRAYQPAYNYGDTINWRYWPIKDNELRWQLHRTKWWIPLGKVYRLSGEERYAQEWVSEYVDWVEDNPLLLNKPTDVPEPEASAMMENVRFAWRPLEVSHRLQDQTILFPLFLPSPSFTPELLGQFLCNYNTHANHIINHYSEKGNHLLFEAQRLLYAGACFPELKDAPQWRKSGIEVLLREIKKQVYADGMQYELDPSYHLAAINIFMKAARMAQVKGFAGEFPQEYFNTIEGMIEVVMNTNFPDYTYPLFSDSRLVDKANMLKNFREFAKLFPNNEQIAYWASNRQKGEKPNYLSRAFKTSGFYIFRNGWEENSTQLVLKAGPKAFWHSQPDNGTFELYVKGRNFFRDSGSFVYGGDEETMKQREWFKQTRVHNTLTLNNENMHVTDSKCLLWSTSPQEDVLVTENQSYPELKHRRTVFFINQQFFVVVDEALGSATGELGIHYHFSEGEVKADVPAMRLTTQYADYNNIALQVLSEQKLRLQEEEGWVSYQIRQKAKRPAYAISCAKNDDQTVRFISVLSPIRKPESAPAVQLLQDNSNEKGLSLKLKIGDEKYVLKTTL